MHDGQRVLTNERFLMSGCGQVHGNVSKKVLRQVPKQKWNYGLKKVSIAPKKSPSELINGLKICVYMYVLYTVDYRSGTYIPGSYSLKLFELVV